MKSQPCSRSASVHRLPFLLRRFPFSPAPWPARLHFVRITLLIGTFLSPLTHPLHAEATPSNPLASEAADVVRSELHRFAPLTPASVQTGGETGDQTPPELVAATARAALVVAHFSEPLDLLSITPARFLVSAAATNLTPSEVHSVPGGKSVVLQLPSPVTDLSVLLLAVQGVTDLAGNTIASDTQLEFRSSTLNTLDLCPGSSVQLIIRCDGPSPLAFQWYYQDEPIPGATSTNYHLPSITREQSGLYTAVCTSSEGTVLADYLVTAEDTEAPTIACPPDRTVECANPAGTQVFYNITASDNCGGTLNVTCTPPPGGRFLPGVTVTRCTITDPSGNTNTCSFTVTVVDTTAPTLVCPGDQFIQSAAPVQIFFTTGAIDNCDSNLVVTCSPPPGTVFPIGTTTVNCSSTDLAANTGYCAFDVTVGQILGIITQPVDQTAHPGGEASFEVVATGLSPFQYQWFHDGAPLLNATNRILQLTQIRLQDQGAYSVRIQNLAASITSQSAALLICEPIPFLAALPDWRVLVNTSQPFVLQTATNLTPPIAWSTVATKAGADCNFEFDAQSLPAAPQRYFRAQTTP